MTVAASLLAACMAASPVAWAEDSDREGRWQFSIPITYLNSTAFDGEGGSSFDLSNDVGFGFGFGYHLNERFYVGGEFTWIDVNYDVSVRSADTPPGPVESLGGEFDASTFQFKGQYNILQKTFTPFISAGLGWTYVDSNIASGPTQGTCWWDPWWGQVCNTWQPTYDDTGFSYGAGAGLRGELTDTFFIEARYNILWIDTDGGDEPDLDGFRLELGWKL